MAIDKREDNQYYYRLNVCAPILFRGTGNLTIPDGVAAHQQKIENLDKYYNLGKVNTKPVVSGMFLSFTIYNK